jgi:hypothetical protein
MGNGLVWLAAYAAVGQASQINVVYKVAGLGKGNELCGAVVGVAAHAPPGRFDAGPAQGGAAARSGVSKAGRMSVKAGYVAARNTGRYPGTREAREGIRG